MKTLVICIIFLVLIILLVTLVIIDKTNLWIKHTHTKDKIFKYWILILGIILVLMEIIKQIYLIVTNNYDYYFDVPVQPCAFAFIFIFVCAMIHEKYKIKEFLYSYLAYVGTLMGLIVLCYPARFFDSSIAFIRFYTILYHLSIFSTGFYILLHKNKSIINHKAFAKMICVFGGLIIFGVILNAIVYSCSNQDINAFYVGWRRITSFFTNIFPFLKNRYWLYLPLYIIIVLTGCYIIYWISFGISKTYPLIYKKFHNH